MGSPFTITSVSNYNANPPPDDGSQVAANLITWAKGKQKLADPIKQAFDTSESATSTAFGKIVGGAGITTTAVTYGVGASDQGKIVKATAAGITITTPDATSVGSPFVFCVLNNSSGDITLHGNGAQTVDGAATVTIPAGCGVMLNTDGSNWFTDGQNFQRTNIIPTGRLTLVSGNPFITTDQVAATSILYTPYQGDYVPIPNGTVFALKEFSELTLTLASQHTADTIFDCFVFLDPADNTTIRLGTGPAWSNSTAGSCARGSGAGTTELVLLKGYYVNNNAITLRNGATTYSVALKSALYVGSFYVDHTAGQVSCHVSYGQNRKWGLWNAFNRKEISLLVGDTTASWAYSTATVRASNNAPSSWSSAEFNVGSGTTCNGCTVLVGLQEEDLIGTFSQYQGEAQLAGTTVFSEIGIGVNSTTTISGRHGKQNLGDSGGGTLTLITMPIAEHIIYPSIGITTFCALENSTTSGQTFFGTQAQMQMKITFRS